MNLTKTLVTLVGSIALVGTVACSGAPGGEESRGEETGTSSDALYYAPVDTSDCNWKVQQPATLCKTGTGADGLICVSSNKSCGKMGVACLSSGFDPT